MENFNLENLDKKDPFKVPNGYFEGLTERIHQRILTDSLEDNAQNDLENNLLKNFDKKQPFGTPEAYFESFSEKLNERIKQENNQENNQQSNQQDNQIYTPKPLHISEDTSVYVRLQTKFRTYAKTLAIAAVLVLVGSFAYVIYDKNQQQNTENLANQNKNKTENLLAFNDIPNEISNNEIVEYLTENHTENNENYVLEHITETHISDAYLEELSKSEGNLTEISKEIPMENLQQNLQQTPTENKDKNIIINDLSKEELKKEIEEMQNNGELEE